MCVHSTSNLRSRDARGGATLTTFRHPSLQERRVMKTALAALSKHPQHLNAQKAYYALSCAYKYTLLELLGHGSYGVVLKGQDREGNLYAIKIAKEPENNRAIQKEAKGLREANACTPNLTVLYQDLQKASLGGPKNCSACCNKRAILITRYGGNTLWQECTCKNPEFSLKQFLRMVRDCTVFAQDIRAYHHMLGDIKSDNIVIDAQGQIRMIDLGEWGNTGDVATWYRTSRWYRSPDVLLKQLRSTQVLFGIGCTLIEIVVGRPLFGEDIHTYANSIQSMRIHLYLVFSLLGLPSWDFVQQIPENLREMFFTLDPVTHNVSLKGLPSENPLPDPNHTKHQLRKEILQAVASSSSAPRVRLGSVNPEIFANHLMDFVLLCLNYEDPSPSQLNRLIAHPLLQLGSSSPEYRDPFFRKN